MWWIEQPALTPIPNPNPYPNTNPSPDPKPTRMVVMSGRYAGGQTAPPRPKAPTMGRARMRAIPCAGDMARYGTQTQG